MARARWQAAGFTLVELVLVILVLSVLAIGVTGFITRGTQIYVDGQLWQRHLGEVRYGAQRLSRELRDAVPGSVTISNSPGAAAQSCIRFLPILRAERYLAAPLPGDATTLLAYPPDCCDGDSNDQLCLDGDDSNNHQICPDFDGAGTAVTLSLLEGYVRHEFAIDSVVLNGELAAIELDRPIEALAYSTGQRYFLSKGEVAWCVSNDGTLQRDGVLMAQGLQNRLTDCAVNGASDPQCPFVETAPGQQRNNTVRLQWWLAQGTLDQRFAQEVQLENVP
ncbi:prepilin-type N-terminal cleavage/methylation domain-containing protein [Ferrimonas pelagia]|uniref:MSHA fimbrial biogenesis protein MshO n=1 Tax=Ferrimonas pelagia TaxID=1177826 RepID=A0ABP9FIV6_9GAMM